MTPVLIAFLRKLWLSCMFLMPGILLADECAVLVVVGMEDERVAAAGSSPPSKSLQIVVGTANAPILRERLQLVDTSHIKAVFSFGVAGALDPALKTGDLLISEQVLSQIKNPDQTDTEVNWPVDNNLLMGASLKASKGKIKFRKGIFLGTDTEARDQTAETVVRLYDITGAHIIDNESHIAAQFASEHNLPFLSIRAVSDSVHLPLPPAALLPLDADDGSPDGLAIARSLLMNPLQVPALIKVALDYQKALTALEEFQEQVGFCLKGSSNSASF